MIATGVQTATATSNTSDADVNVIVALKATGTPTSIDSFLRPGAWNLHLGDDSYPQRLDLWLNHLLHHQRSHADHQFDGLFEPHLGPCHRNNRSDGHSQRLCQQRGSFRGIYHRSAGSHAHLQPCSRNLCYGADGNHQRFDLWRDNLLHHQWLDADDNSTSYTRRSPFRHRQ